MNTINVTAIPGEALATAIFNFAAKLLEFAAVERQTMDASLLKRRDEMGIKGLERADRFLEQVQSSLPKLPV